MPPMQLNEPLQTATLTQAAPSPTRATQIPAKQTLSATQSPLLAQAFPGVTFRRGGGPQLPVQQVIWQALNSQAPSRQSAESKHGSPAGTIPSNADPQI